MSKVISRDEMQLHLGDFNTLLQRQPHLLESVGGTRKFSWHLHY